MFCCCSYIGFLLAISAAAIQSWFVGVSKLDFLVVGLRGGVFGYNIFAILYLIGERCYIVRIMRY